MGLIFKQGSIDIEVNDQSRGFCRLFFVFRIFRGQIVLGLFLFIFIFFRVQFCRLVIGFSILELVSYFFVQSLILQLENFLFIFQILEGIFKIVVLQLLLVISKICLDYFFNEFIRSRRIVGISIFILFCVLVELGVFVNLF